MADRSSSARSVTRGRHPSSPATAVRPRPTGRASGARTTRRPTGPTSTATRRPTGPTSTATRRPGFPARLGAASVIALLVGSCVRSG